jgi:mRNA-degrading endonuclease RelE of RelBE toxin-antitoxin system
MPYEVFTTSATDRMLKKLARQVQRHVLQEAARLVEDPIAGSQLEGELRGFRCVRTIFMRTHYRIVYQFNPTKKAVTIVTIGSRENFYQQLRRLKLRSQ